MSNTVKASPPPGEGYGLNIFPAIGPDGKVWVALGASNPPLGQSVAFPEAAIDKICISLRECADVARRQNLGLVAAGEDDLALFKEGTR